MSARSIESIPRSEPLKGGLAGAETKRILEGKAEKLMPFGPGENTYLFDLAPFCGGGVESGYTVAVHAQGNRVFQR